MPKNAFGPYFKDLRIRRKLTLRQFCLEHGYDPGNISKLERGLLPPPDSDAKLTEYAKALKVRRGVRPGMNSSTSHARLKGKFHPRYCASGTWWPDCPCSSGRFVGARSQRRISTNSLK